MKPFVLIAICLALLGGAYVYLMPDELGSGFEPIGVERGVHDLPRRVRHTPTGIVLVLIPSGRFVMGTPDAEQGRDGDEAQHEVEIDEAFYLAETEVTVALWKQVMGEEPETDYPETDYKDDDLPMTGVSWHRAIEFVGRMNAAGEGGWRLPGEHEWEYACRAGTRTVFAYGDNITPEQVNYHGRYPYAGAPRGLVRDGPVPVRSLPPNPWGLYEIHGNVWEWCEDLYTFDPLVKKSSGDPGDPRVMRGGSFESQAEFVRSGHRDGYPPGSSGPKYGFRLAKSLP